MAKNEYLTLGNGVQYVRVDCSVHNNYLKRVISLHDSEVTALKSTIAAHQATIKRLEERLGDV